MSEGKRPRLASEIAEVGHSDSDLLADFPVYRRLDRLAGLHETSQARIHPTGPTGVRRGEQRPPVVPLDQHDHGRGQPGEREQAAVRAASGLLTR